VIWWLEFAGLSLLLTAAVMLVVLGVFDDH
jgi:hypothetical protein